MKQSVSRTVSAAIAVAGLALSGMVYAQTGTGMTGGSAMGQGMGADQRSQMQNMQELSGVMRDMSGQMMNLSRQMSQGNMSPAMQEQMGQRMQQMSGMMSTMSGMMAQGMVGAGTQARMQEMRHGMDRMMQSAPAGTK